jgi:hypothetical protein
MREKLAAIPLWMDHPKTMLASPTPTASATERPNNNKRSRRRERFCAARRTNSQGSILLVLILDIPCLNGAAKPTLLLPAY